MHSYDISHLPQHVHDTVLHLMETLVQAFPQLAEEPTDTTPRAGPHPHPLPPGEGPVLPQHAVMKTAVVPTPVLCPHGTRETPCCAACTTLYRAEAVLVDVQTEGAPRFPRSEGELRVLAALQALSPMPATSIQVAAMVDLPHLEVRTILQALALLETVEHPHRGYYRHRVTEAVREPPDARGGLGRY